MERLLVVSSSPHIHSPLDTQKIMGWVLAALAPAGLAGVYFFGARAAVVMAVCVISCVAFEYLWQKLTKRTVTVDDLSAAVTGLLLAYNLPPTIPFWMAVIGCLFSIIVVKQLYGGLGCNIVNPALAGRAMMLTSWPVPLTTWTLDGVSGATPLAMIKAGALDGLPRWSDMFIGHVGGCIGETSAAALLVGFAILLYKDVIKWHIPVVYIAVAAALCALFGRPVGPLQEIFSGGLFLGAIFMATDYTTTPVTPRGQMIFAAGCGVLTALIRSWGGYPEGVSYSILIMNLTVPLIDRATKPRIFGEVKKHG
ncbi:RnfABCDGE type electron transport complex subunit D [Synergistes jonesii]|uniref:RnfABCDGE type electron transport complex subunit D n=1 Tax=Synergistes jonesii TaxID=2754 RepID=UPI00331AFAD3